MVLGQQSCEALNLSHLSDLPDTTETSAGHKPVPAWPVPSEAAKSQTVKLSEAITQHKDDTPGYLGHQSGCSAQVTPILARSWGDSEQ